MAEDRPAVPLEYLSVPGLVSKHLSSQKARRNLADHHHASPWRCILKKLHVQGWRHDVGLPRIKDHLGGQGCLPHAHQHQVLPVLIRGSLRLLGFVVPLLEEAGDDCIQVQG